MVKGDKRRLAFQD
jgi:tRNA-guanine family transglycosylase